MLPVITISRQYGSGGHEVGEKVAQKLDGHQWRHRHHGHHAEGVRHQIAAHGVARAQREG